MATVQRVLIQAISNSLYFYPEVPSGLNVLGQASYGEQLMDWQPRLPYNQKALFTDNISLQFHCGYSSSLATTLSAAVYITDYLGNVIAGVDLNTAPYLKGVQTISGNTFTFPNGGVNVPLKSYQWAFTFGDFPSEIPDGGDYYVKLVVSLTDIHGTTTSEYFSEVIRLTDSHPDTKLFQYLYNTNIASKNIVNSGWFNDYPTNSQPYTLSFSLRSEAYINLFSPKVINVGYSQQNYQQVQIKTRQVTTYTLKVGEISIGIPYYMLQKLTEALLADTLYIDNFAYIVYNPQGQTSLSDMWKIKDSDISPLVFAQTAIMLVSESQNALVSPTPPRYGRIFTDEFDDTFG